jgi:hypothetical protein
VVPSAQAKKLQNNSLAGKYQSGLWIPKFITSEKVEIHSPLNQANQRQ